MFRIRCARLLSLCVNAIILETASSFVSPEYVCSPFTSPIRLSSTRVYSPRRPTLYQRPYELRVLTSPTSCPRIAYNDLRATTLYYRIDQNATGLYQALMAPISNHLRTHYVSKEDEAYKWHRRLGHVSAGTIQKTIPMVTGISVKGMNSIPFCDPWELAKSNRSPRPKVRNESRRSTKPQDLLHADFVGPTRQASLKGSKYFIPMNDDAIGLSLIRFMRLKSHANSMLKDMMTELETVFRGKVKSIKIRSIRSGNAKELISDEFENWLSKRGTSHEKSAPYSPESNGKAKRLNRTLTDMARSMLVDARPVPNRNQLWAEAIHTTNYLRNRMYTSAGTEGNITPYEAIMGKKPGISHIRLFGSKACMHIRKKRRSSKFGERAQIWYCVGYTS